MRRIRSDLHLTLAKAAVVAIFTAALLGQAVPAFAALPGHIRGAVHDGSGSPILGAAVSVPTVDGALVATTSASGAYDLSVPAGTYRVSVSAPSFVGSGYPSPVAVAAGATRYGVDVGLVLRPTIDASSVLTTLPASPGERPLASSGVRLTGDRVTWFQAGDDLTGAPWKLWTRSVGDPSPSLVATLPYMSWAGAPPYDVSGDYAFVSEMQGLVRYDLATHERSDVDTSPGLALIDQGPIAGDKWVSWTEYLPDTGVTELVSMPRAGGAKRRINFGYYGVNISHGGMDGDNLAVAVTDFVGVTWYRVYDLAKSLRLSGGIGPLEYDYLAQGPVLLGNRLLFQDATGTKVMRATLAAPTPVLVASMNAVPDPFDGYAGFSVADLTAEGHRAIWTETRWSPGAGQHPWSIRSWDASVPAGSSVSAIASSTSLASGVGRGPADVYDDRFVWVDRFGWGSAGGSIQTRLASETDPTRMDAEETVAAGQSTPILGQDRVFWLDDRAYPGDAPEVFDLYERPIAGGPESLVATDVGPWRSDSSSAGDRVAFVKKYADSAAPAQLIVKDAASGDSTLVAASSWDPGTRTRKDIGAVCLNGDWLYYGVSVSQADIDLYTDEIRAYRLSTGARRLVATFPGLLERTGELSAGSGQRLTYQGLTGLLSYDPVANRSSAAFAGWSPDMQSVQSWPYALTSDMTRWDALPPTYAGFSYLTATTATGRVFTVDPAPSLGDETLALRGTTGILGDDIYDMLTGIYYDLGYSRDISQADPEPQFSPLLSADIRGDRVALQVLDEDRAPRTVLVDLASVLWNPTRRLAGTSRYSTSVQLSQDMTAADTVVVATGLDFPDALSGAPLAEALGAPVLLVEPNAVPPEVSAEIDRLGATKVVILGGTKSVSAAVAETLSDGHSRVVTRVAGNSRYETSALIAIQVMEAHGGGPIGDAFIATGQGYADSLSGSPVAAHMGAPILLTPPGGLSSVTEDALNSLETTHAVLLGGTRSVSAAVETRLIAKGIACERLEGTDRFATSRKAADYGLAHGLTMDEALLTTGWSFADGLGAGAYGARAGVNLLLVDNNKAVLTPGVEDLLLSHKAEVKGITVVGGEASVWLPLQQAAAQAIFTPK